MQGNQSQRVSRRMFLTATGGAATTAAIAGCLDLDDDDDDVDEDDPIAPPDDPGAHMQKAQDAWDRVVANPEPENEDIRNEAYVEMEEAIRDDMILLPLFHGKSERFWYDWVDIEPMGPLGGHHQEYKDVELDTGHEEKDENVFQLINSTISTLDPIQSTDTASATVINQVYECLTDYPAGVTELENQLAEEVDVSDDLLTYTISIKEGVEFHNGDELTADDIVYSWRRLAESPASFRDFFILDTSSGLGIDHEADEDGVVPDSMELEAVDDYTIEFTLAVPNPAALDIISYDGFAAVPENLAGDIEGYEGEYEQEDLSTEVMVGTGAFEFDEWVPASSARVTRNENFHDDNANVEAIEWTILEDDDAIWTRINERNVDVFGIPTVHYSEGNVDIDEVDDFERSVGTYGPLDNDETVNYVAVEDISTFYVGFNGGQTIRAARQAVAFLTDHEELIDEVFEGRGVEAFSFIPPALWPDDVIAYEDWVDEWPYSNNETDRDGATDVLEDAGYTEDDPYDITFTTYASEAFQQFGTLTRDKADGTGLDVEIEEAEFATLISRGREGDLQMFSLGWIWSWEDIAYGMYGFEPRVTNTDIMPEEADGYMLDWEKVAETEE